MSNIEVFLDAYGNLRRVGLLRRHAGAGRERVTYEHDEKWLEMPEAFQFDPSLPLTRGIHTPPGRKEMFGTLGDSAPDTWGRELMRRKERRAAELEKRQARALHETDFLLGVLDETRLGALRFRFEGEEEFLAPRGQGVPTIVALGKLLQASQRILRGDESDEDLLLIFAPGSSLGGARPKASVLDQYNNLSIAKFPKETDVYSISRWEAIALDMARDVGISTIDYDLIPSDYGPVFITRRFDRAEGQRIPFISAMAMTEHNDGDEDGSYLEILDALADHGADPKKDRIELFRRIAFSILSSNTDDHLRNHGFLWQGRRGWALSPCYDLNPVPDAPRILKTRIDFEDGTASLRLLGEVAEYFGTQSVTDDIIRQCVSVTKNWKQYAQRRHAPQGEIARMIPAFEHEDLEYALTI
ncbi:type II toxin-antitoxin system HipA family toxin [Cohaesibacter haloalkalitolerans]|uniref:type II toxin-antitoxin system HipA family toxin n=1 Tax=Cohaesibacter haloalkalitolerans TaxID=1162980 RepID=UPI000E653970|nr:HipA domain-containing protein [Cohaesibacter haloalkalitolerans]